MDTSFFQGNRQSLLRELKKGALIVLTGYGEMQRVNDSAQFFEQEANFWYLTGIEAPDWWVILDGSHGTEWLVAPDVSEVQRIFDGSLSAEHAAKISGISTVIDRDEAMRRLRQMAAKHHSVVYTTEQPRAVREHASFQLNHTQADLKNTLSRVFKNVQLCNRELAVLRTIKQESEVATIQKAINVTIAAFEAVKPVLATVKHEYELEAHISYEVRRRGARHAYDPIIAGGARACTLHYVTNEAMLSRRDLVLFDVGARWHGYAADISRTYTPSGPTKRQREIHEAVEVAHHDCIDLLKPGLRFDEYFQKVDDIMKSALTSVKLSPDRYREYFPHSISHGLGIDVHDVLAGYDELRPGMVLTVEPGLYIREEGIGIRIEDDILITDSGHKNLSSRLSTHIE